MKKAVLVAPALVLALAACGSSTDASEEAIADTVEIPADSAMQNTPDPVPMEIEAPAEENPTEEAAAGPGDAEAAAAAAAAVAEEAAAAEAASGE